MLNSTGIGIQEVYQTIKGVTTATAAAAISEEVRLSTQ